MKNHSMSKPMPNVKNITSKRKLDWFDRLQHWICQKTGRQFRYCIELQYVTGGNILLWSTSVTAGFSCAAGIEEHRLLKRIFFGKGCRKKFPGIPVCNGKIYVVPVSYLGWF
jgi:hypothetical protein